MGKHSKREPSGDGLERRNGGEKTSRLPSSQEDKGHHGWEKSSPASVEKKVWGEGRDDSRDSQSK